MAPQVDEWGRTYNARRNRIPSRGEFEARAWEMLGAEMQRVSSWVPMIYAMRREQKRRAREWELATMGIEQRNALALEAARSASRMDELQFEWKQRGLQAEQERKAEAEADLLEDALPQPSLDYLASKGYEFIKTKSELDAFMPFIKAEGAERDERAEKQLVQQEAQKLARDYPDLAPVVPTISTLPEIRALRVAKVKEVRAAEEKAEKERIEKEEADFTREFESLESERNLPKYTKLGPGDRVYSAANWTAPGWVEARRLGYTPLELMERPWLGTQIDPIEELKWMARRGTKEEKEKARAALDAAGEKW